jgi:hypothetical protein
MSGNTNRLDWADTAKGRRLSRRDAPAYGVGDDTGHIGYLNHIIGWPPVPMPILPDLRAVPGY